jgi:hypothetical protein
MRPTLRSFAPWAGLALGLAAMFGVSAAQAVPTFPGEVQRALGMPCAPPCTICHSTSLGGIGTVVKPFGEALRARGLVGGDVPSLRRALAALEAERVDSNHDGTDDVQELRQGRNPNDGSELCGLKYGCAQGAGSTGRSRGLGGAAIGGSVLLALWAQRRRKLSARGAATLPR